MNEEIIAISIDTDWVPDEIVEHTLKLLDKYSIPATFFLTNQINLDFSKHEIAIHPNFQSEIKDKSETIEVDDYEYRILSAIHSLYPDSKGIRTHSLYSFNRLYKLFSDFGLEYASNFEMPFQSDIKPFPSRYGVIQVPIYMMDDFILKNYSIIKKKHVEVFAAKNYITRKSGLKVFDFHPIHIYINTCSEEHYLSCKKHYHNPKKLEEFRFQGKGIATLFEEILEKISLSSVESMTLIDAIDKYTENIL